MTENEVLAALSSGDQDAEDILLGVMPSAARRWKKLNKDIEKFLHDVKQHFPDATYYTASGGFNLLLGNSHGGPSGEIPQQELEALHQTGDFTIGDGDW